MEGALHSKDELTELAHQRGIDSWESLLGYIQKLPYGRNQNRSDLKLVFIENKGTCSSKHALLKEIADRNHILGVKLILGLYKMNHFNTPKIGNELINHDIAYIPEAHCYLKINDSRIDVTSPDSEFSRISKDLIEEVEITPTQVNEYKVAYHKNYLQQWVNQSNCSFDFEEIWSIREKCIQKLSE